MAITKLELANHLHKKMGLPKNYLGFNKIKSIGFSDKKLSEITKVSENII